MGSLIGWTILVVYGAMAYRAFKRVINVGLNGPESDYNGSPDMKVILIFAAIGAGIIAPFYWLFVGIVHSPAMRTASEQKADIEAREQRVREAELVIEEWDRTHGEGV